MVNYETRRLARMPDDIRQKYATLMPDPPRSCIPAEETRLRLPSTSSENYVHHRASPTHMDMNNHVNNTAYITWILDALPDDLQQEYVLAQYEVDYKAEGLAGLVLCKPFCASLSMQAFGSSLFKIHGLPFESVAG
jgi:fatty acyl-ACP thioesterase A